MKKFSQTNVSFFNFDIIFHFIGSWSLGIMLVVAYFIHDQIAILVIAAILLLFPPGYKYLYYRWLMFQYNKTTSLSIDTEKRTFTYIHDGNKISFTSGDIAKLGYKTTGAYMFLCNEFIEIIDITLKDGQTLKISSGIGTDDLIRYINNNRVELCLPYLSWDYNIDFDAYIEDIS